MSSIPVLAIRRKCAQITVGLNNQRLQAIQSLKTKSRTSGTTGSYHEAAVSGHAADENEEEKSSLQQINEWNSDLRIKRYIQSPTHVSVASLPAEISA
ncbi:hypothetical protein T10_6970 [Trichinella papuae]|uniref:Uncharacterized protein n=1 Tax=Trichinella papuae TaxID=268474 RepID=A0A0V1N4B6_9BILA|nr:hypothetical protein T10_6970 [Trichinella papuae]